MTSIREGILTYVASALAATSGVSGRVYRSREEAVSRGESPALLIKQGESKGDYSNYDFIDWATLFSVGVITRGATPDQLADPIINSIYAILMADRTLGGRVFDIIPQGIVPHVIEGDKPAGVTEVVFKVTYRTTSGSLEA